MQFSVRGGFLTVLSVLTLLGAQLSVQATTYYVSASGNDSNSGTSTSAAWKTVTKVNSKNFAAGDEVRFEGGKKFGGKLLFDVSDKGTTDKPIVVSSYGIGRATIDGGTGNAFYAYNVGCITIANLNFVGAGPTTSTADGVVFYADLANNVKIQNVTIDNAEVSGFGKSGINIGAWNGSTAYRNVRVTNVSMHDNLQAGMGTYAAVANANENVYVGHCVAYNNFGDPKSTKNTGSGIVLGDVNGGTIERCAAYDNGKNNLTPSEGPAGIWCYDSINVVIQYNEAFRNRTGSGADGDGFDLDINVKNSVLQYNYSHDNDGAGYLLCAGPSNDGNTVRYNVSQNDGRKNGYGAIQAYGAVSNAKIYNNTIFVSQSTTGPRAVNFYSPTTNVRFYNNIFYTTSGAQLLQIASGQSGMTFQGNDYYTAGSTFKVVYNGATYSTLAAWQSATGQEKSGSTSVGLNVDPKLVNAGNGGTFTNANLLSNLTAYSLQTTSPMIDKALNVTSLVGSSPTDYFGNAAPYGKGYDVGAAESVPKTTTVATRLSAPQKTGNLVQLTLDGPAGTTNIIEMTTNFVTWNVLTNLVNDSGTVTVTDSTANGRARFYRVRTDS